ncbi:alkaline phosphatase family protein [Sphingomonas sp. PB4P5]|uniref:alkaline phosphatase family protein n=1 Tax=Parasphingomonas puruogangriensis TaxID=3096155 RepID=UPI002FC8A6B4
MLLISVDGMQPLDVIAADKRGFRVPNLRRLMASGTHASGVRNSLPTATYPNHTSMVTGVWPVRHGIENNQVFDPTGANLDGWHWYAEDIKVPTLWDAAHAASRSTASISWPATVGMAAIDYNIPDYWRARTPEDVKLVRALSTPGLLTALEKNGAPLAPAIGGDVASDQARARLAETIYALKRPYFFTLHFISLDEAEHDHGPGSAEAIDALQAIDAAIGELIAKARAVEPDLIVAVVSDHGFAPVHTAVNLTRAFAEAGLLTLDPATGKVLNWKAVPWGRGSAAVTLADPGDAATARKTRALLDRLAADPANGIGKIIDHNEVVAMGGTAAASFWMDFKLGFSNSGSTRGPLIQPYSLKGTHGYFPTHPEMWASFFIAGPGVPRRGSIGSIDQRDIAPTIAKLLGVSLPSADGKPLF